MKRLLAVFHVLAAMMATSVLAATETVNGVTWEFNIQGGEATITAPNTESSCGNIPALTGDFTLPSTLGGCPVTRLAAGVLWGATELTSLVVPDSVRTIDNGALWYLTGATNVVIGAGVESLGQPFFGWLRLESIEVVEGNTAYCVRDGVLYEKSLTHLIAYPCMRTGESFVIPECVVSLGIHAFDTPHNLVRVVVPASVTAAYYAAFCDCYRLESIVFKGDAPATWDAAFLRLPENCVIYIEKDASGWDDDGDGTWNGVRLAYSDGSGFVAPDPVVEPSPAPLPEPPAVAVPARTFDGYLVDAAEAVKGTVQVKVGKSNVKTGLASVKASVLLADGTKKSLKSVNNGKTLISADGSAAFSLAGGEACSVVLDGDELSGVYGSFRFAARGTFSRRRTRPS